jgi:hypothetical protein
MKCGISFFYIISLFSVRQFTRNSRYTVQIRIDFFRQFCSLSLSTLPEKCGRLFHPFVLKSGQKIALLIAHQTPLKAFGSGYAEKEHCRCNRFLCIFAGGFQRKRTLDEEKK